MEKPVRATVFVSGRVQGVGYRYWTENTAQNLGLTGYVRNLPDGRVEAVFEGSEALVGQMLELLRQGPPLSRVDDLAVSRTDSFEKYEVFSVRY